MSNQLPNNVKKLIDTYLESQTVLKLTRNDLTTLYTIGRLDGMLEMFEARHP